MRIVGWAPDSSAFYFYYSWAYDGWYTLFNGSNLQMFNVETGELTHLVYGCCMAFSFLPDMSKIAYTSAGQIGVYDIATDQERSVDIRSDNVDQAGYIHWSPSGNAIVFTVLKDDLGNSQAIYVDVKSMKQKVLIEAFIEDFGFYGWTETESPQYGKINPETKVVEVIVIDPGTGIITTIGTRTPTPTPTPTPRP